MRIVAFLFGFFAMETTGRIGDEFHVHWPWWAQGLTVVVTFYGAALTFAYWLDHHDKRVRAEEAQLDG